MKIEIIKIIKQRQNQLTCYTTQASLHSHMCLRTQEYQHRRLKAHLQSLRAGQSPSKVKRGGGVNSKLHGFNVESRLNSTPPNIQMVKQGGRGLYKTSGQTGYKMCYKIKYSRVSELHPITTLPAKKQFYHTFFSSGTSVDWKMETRSECF